MTDDQTRQALTTAINRRRVAKHLRWRHNEKDHGKWRYNRARTNQRNRARIDRKAFSKPTDRKLLRRFRRLRDFNPTRWKKLLADSFTVDELDRLQELFAREGKPARVRAIDEALQAVAVAKQELVAKHKPGGKDHNQKLHGRWARGRASTPDASSQTSPSPQGSPRASRPPSASPPGGRGTVDLSQLREDRQLVTEQLEALLAEHGQQLKLIQENAGIDKMSKPGKRRGEDTMGMYGIWEGDDFLGWQPDRVVWQNQVLSQMEREQAERNGRPPKAEKTAIIMAGLPGAGKTFVLKSVLSEQVDLRDFLVINADDIKEKIIFEDDPPQVEGVEGMGLASLVHEESSSMSKRWEASAAERGLNIALDITAAKKEKTLRRIKRLKDAGYKIMVAHVDIDPDEAIVSTLKRFGRSGRPVPPSFIRDMAREDGGDVIDEAATAYREVADEFWWYRNYPVSRRPPVLVDSKTATQGQAPQAPQASQSAPQREEQPAGV